MTQLNRLAVHPDPGSIRTGLEARLLFRDGKVDPFI